MDKLPNAGLVRRLAALFYDALVVGSLLLIVSAVATSAFGEIPPGQPYFRIALLLVIVAYPVFFWVRSGQTVGMKAWGLVLTTANGKRLNTGQAFARVAAAALAIAPAGIGYLVALFDREHRTLHDRLTNTRVVRPPR